MNNPPLRIQTIEDVHRLAPQQGGRPLIRNLRGANASGANLEGADLTHVDLRNANLTGANLSGANLAVAKLMNANLTDADLTGATLQNTKLSGANLTDADLTGAKFYNVLAKDRDGNNINVWEDGIEAADIIGIVGISISYVLFDMQTIIENLDNIIRGNPENFTFDDLAGIVFPHQDINDNWRWGPFFRYLEEEVWWYFNPDDDHEGISLTRLLAIIEVLDEKINEDINGILNGTHNPQEGLGTRPSVEIMQLIEEEVTAAEEEREREEREERERREREERERRELEDIFAEVDLRLAEERERHWRERRGEERRGRERREGEGGRERREREGIERWRERQELERREAIERVERFERMRDAGGGDVHQSANALINNPHFRRALGYDENSSEHVDIREFFEIMKAEVQTNPVYKSEIFQDEKKGKTKDELKKLEEKKMREDEVKRGKLIEHLSMLQSKSCNTEENYYGRAEGLIIKNAFSLARNASTDEDLRNKFFGLYIDLFVESAIYAYAKVGESVSSTNISCVRGIIERMYTTIFPVVHATIDDFEKLEKEKGIPIPEPVKILSCMGKVAVNSTETALEYAQEWVDSYTYPPEEPSKYTKAELLNIEFNRGIWGVLLPDERKESLRNFLINKFQDTDDCYEINKDTIDTIIDSTVEKMSYVWQNEEPIYGGQKRKTRKAMKSKKARKTRKAMKSKKTRKSKNTRKSYNKTKSKKPRSSKKSRRNRKYVK